MKPADQIKVIVLSLFSVVVMVSLIAFVSVETSKAVAGHEGEHASSEMSAEHSNTESNMEQNSSEKTEEQTATTEETKTTTETTEEKTEEKAVKTAALSGDPEKGSKVFLSKTCNACHTISSLPGAVGTIGPKLDGLASRAGERKPGMDAVAYITESIETPSAFIVPGFQNMMTPGLRNNMTDEEFQDLLAFLMTLKS